MEGQGGQGGQGGEIVSHTHLYVSSLQDAVKSQKKVWEFAEAIKKSF